MTGAIQLTVEDTGTGIEPEDLPRIFDRFYKGRDSRGMGLGLAIAKWAVEANGGTIDLEPTAAGSTFWIVLPRAA